MTMRFYIAYALFFVSVYGYRIALGSCHNTKRIKSRADSDIWEKIADRSPEVFIWGGDIIYADKVDYSELFTSAKHFSPALPLDLKAKYEELKNLPAYRVFEERIGVKNIYGIWDDHDFGWNDAGNDYPYRVESQEAFLDFFGVSKDSSRRRQEGIYHSIYLNDNKVKVILLDNRFHKDPYRNKTGDFLGEDQWQWLEKELNEVSPETLVTLIVSGIQVLPNDIVRSRCCENWNRHPAARQRLIKLISRSRVVHPLLLSGDVHFGEISLAKCHTSFDDGYLLPELTTSGLTHSWQDYPRLATFGMNTLHTFARSPYQIKGKYFLDRNFGEVEITKTHVEIRLFDRYGLQQLSERFAFDELKKPNQFGSKCGPIKRQHIARRILGLFVAVLILFTIIIALPLLMCRLLL